MRNDTLEFIQKSEIISSWTSSVNIKIRGAKFNDKLEQTFISTKQTIIRLTGQEMANMVREDTESRLIQYIKAYFNHWRMLLKAGFVLGHSKHTEIIVTIDERFEQLNSVSETIKECIRVINGKSWKVDDYYQLAELENKIISKLDYENINEQINLFNYQEILQKFNKVAK